MDKKLTIQLEDYHYGCGDGCCSEYGTNITVNGTKLYQDGLLKENLLLSVLNHLGYQVEIENIRDGEVVSSLKG